MSPLPVTPTNLLGMAVDAMPDGFMIVDRDHRILHWSRAAAQLTGIPPEAALGHDCQQLLRGGACPFGDCALNGQSLDSAYFEFILPENRRLPILRSARPLHDDTGRTHAAVVTFRALGPTDGNTLDDTPVATVAGEDPFRRIIGRSAAIRKVVDTIRRVAPSDATVLVTGESGTGKELVARAIHDASRRARQPLVVLNCAAIPHELLESELFGHARGSFTGATREHRGLVAAAQGGTLFLDEIGDMAPALQAKLLRLLQERQYQRVGETTAQDANVRIVAATNVDLEKAIAEGRFRADLYFRLCVIPLHLPPLRERREDIAPLANYLLSRRAITAHRRPMHFSPEALRLLENAAWEGNVRQLINVVDYVIALCDADMVSAHCLPENFFAGKRAWAPPARGRYQAPARGEAEAARIQAALAANGYHRQRTADALGMDRVTLYRKMREYGLGDSGDPS